MVRLPINTVPKLPSVQTVDLQPPAPDANLVSLVNQLSADSAEIKKQLAGIFTLLQEMNTRLAALEKAGEKPAGRDE